MRKLLQYFLKRPLTWMANHLSASPQRKTVFRSLSRLYKSSSRKKSRRVISIDMNTATDHFIIFSDQHKGNKDRADDFTNCESNYIAALQYYHSQCFHYINLGDCEELWKYRPDEVIPHVRRSLEAEASFQHDNRYYRCFGNHDLIWKNKWDVNRMLKNDFRMPLTVSEGIILRTTIKEQALNFFLTHGHQGDKMSDNNALSTWIVAHLWAPVQRYLQINVNTPSKDDTLRNKHNKLMYEWSSSHKNMILVTGHTHKPVFASGRYSQHPSNKIETNETEKLKPSYFNTGCCCFNDGDITGIEIEAGCIRLVKWHSNNASSSRTVLEEVSLEKMIGDMDRT